jgi:hypothetical protein
MLRRTRLAATLAALALPLLLPAVGLSQGPPKKEAPAENPTVSQLLETVGTLAGTNLYQSYLNIGLLADGRAEGLYSEDDAKQLLTSVLKPLDATDKQLEKVAKLVSTKEDKEAVEKFRKLNGLLRQQGEHLQAFWASGKEEDSKKYEAARKDAWDGISSLLGLDKQP